MLKKIYIDGFRNFKNFILEPNFPHTLLCGLNGTGKTTVIEVLSRLQTFLINSKPIADLYDADSIPRWEEKEIGHFMSTLGFSLEIEKVPYDYEITVNYNFKEGLCRVEKESLRVNGNAIFSSNTGEATVVSDDAKPSTFPIDWGLTGLQLASRRNSKIRTFLVYVENNIFALSINPFLEFSESNSTKNFLGLECENFSEWYEKISSENIADVANSFQHIKPFVRGFKQFKYKQYGVKKELFVDIHKKDIAPYELHFNELSHGQKILCILYLVLSVCPKDSIVFVDEFENFLSPIELQPLYDLIQDIFEDKNIQTIIVSHHHKTLEWFKDTAFILYSSHDNSFVKIEKFSNSSDISIDEYLLELMEDE